MLECYISLDEKTHCLSGMGLKLTLRKKPLSGDSYYAPFLSGTHTNQKELLSHGASFYMITRGVGEKELQIPCSFKKQI